MVKNEDLGKKNEGGNEDYLRPISRAHHTTSNQHF
jgi:hypothetical protein